MNKSQSVSRARVLAQELQTSVLGPFDYRLGSYHRVRKMDLMPRRTSQPDPGTTRFPIPAVAIRLATRPPRQGFRPGRIRARETIACGLVRAMVRAGRPNWSS